MIENKQVIIRGNKYNFKLNNYSKLIFEKTKGDFSKIFTSIEEQILLQYCILFANNQNKQAFDKIDDFIAWMDNTEEYEAFELIYTEIIIEHFKNVKKKQVAINLMMSEA